MTTRQLILSLIAFFLAAAPVHAQMMGRYAAPSSSASSEAVTQTAQDEAEGKAVWEKLQNKTVTCNELTDDDFDVLGDYFMGSMLGANHADMNARMSDRLGDDGEKNMHIAMGKRMSGCDPTATIAGSKMGFAGGDMMYSRTTKGLITHAIFGITVLFTWVLGMLFLLSGTVFFWKEIRKRK